MNDSVYKEFLSCIKELGDLRLSENKFLQKQRQFNDWLISLEEDQRQHVINQVIPVIIKTAELIQTKQQAYKEMIVVNEGIMKANSQYDKF